jgi:hypothetical protein
VYWCKKKKNSEDQQFGLKNIYGNITRKLPV